jgi:ubiquinone/menaquinone biosynthesis C-methylase UbiE
MSDVYAAIGQADEAVQEQLAGVLELRAADPQQIAMRESYLAQVHFVPGARVLEVGCGTGGVARALAALPRVGIVVGLDPSPVFLARARSLAEGIEQLSFVEGDARALPLEDASFDVVVFHTSLCHIPAPERALAEAFRVLDVPGQLAIFDGDYATISLATSDTDPLQACADAVIATLVHDPWLMRRLSPLVANAGFVPAPPRGHAYLETSSPGYLLTIADRGADALVSLGTIGDDTAASLKAEARRRAGAGSFFGSIAYVSLLAEKTA